MLYLLFFDDAKLRRFSSDSKKFHGFFSNLCGQTPDLWPNRGNRFKNCPKAHVTECPDPSVSCDNQTPGDGSFLFD